MITEKRRDISLYIPIYLILIVIYVMAGILSPNFFSWRNNVNLMSRVVPLVLVGIAQTFVILGGGIDLSVGSIISVANVVAASLPFIDSPANIALWCVVPPVIGGLLGAFNGFLIARKNFPPFIVTLANSAIFLGLALFVMSQPGGTISISLATWLNSNIFGVPVPLIILVSFIAMAHFILSYTPLGRSIYAIGGNEVVAMQSGINVQRVKIFSYTLSGVFSGIAGAYLSAWMFSADPLIGEPYVMNSIAVAVIGGTLLTGGRGGVLGVIGGAYIFYIINNILNLLSISTFYQYVARGLILIIALMLSSRETMGGKR